MECEGGLAVFLRALLILRKMVFYMSKKIELRFGDEAISNLLLKNIRTQIKSVNEFRVSFEKNLINLIVSGSYMLLSGRAEFDLTPEKISEDLAGDETLVFRIVPKNSFSSILKGSAGFFKGKLEPGIKINNDLIIINLKELLKKANPDSIYLVDLFFLKELEISEGSLRISLEMK